MPMPASGLVSSCSAANSAIFLFIVIDTPVILANPKAALILACPGIGACDASIKDIFCIEDIVVLAQLVVGQL